MDSFCLYYLPDCQSSSRAIQLPASRVWESWAGFGIHSRWLAGEAVPEHPLGTKQQVSGAGLRRCRRTAPVPLRFPVWPQGDRQAWKWGTGRCTAEGESNCTLDNPPLISLEVGLRHLEHSACLGFPFAKECRAESREQAGPGSTRSHSWVDRALPSELSPPVFLPTTL